MICLCILGGVTNCTIEHNYLRNTGDDSIAMWSQASIGADEGNTIAHNTVQLPILANGIAVYGGISHQLPRVRAVDVEGRIGVPAARRRPELVVRNVHAFGSLVPDAGLLAPAVPGLERLGAAPRGFWPVADARGVRNAPARVLLVVAQLGGLMEEASVTHRRVVAAQGHALVALRPAEVAAAGIARRAGARPACPRRANRDRVLVPDDSDGASEKRERQQRRDRAPADAHRARERGTTEQRPVTPLWLSPCCSCWVKGVNPSRSWAFPAPARKKATAT